MVTRPSRLLSVACRAASRRDRHIAVGEPAAGDHARKPGQTVPARHHVHHVRVVGREARLAEGPGVSVQLLTSRSRGTAILGLTPREAGNRERAAGIYISYWSISIYPL